MGSKKDVIEKLIKVQKQLKVPKNAFNKFGGYNYRSLETILEKAKPVCADEGLLLYCTDEIVTVGERVYVKATATVTDGESEHSVTAYAREAETKKGMDDSQITGTASSYARKYACNALFNLDDTKDADTNEYQGVTGGSTESVKDKKINKTEIKAITATMERKGVDPSKVLGVYGLNSIEDMTVEQFYDANKKLDKYKDKEQ